MLKLNLEIPHKNKVWYKRNDLREDKTEIIYKYIYNKMSSRDIAKEYKCSFSTILSLLKNNGINTKERQNSSKTKFKKGIKSWNTGLTKEIDKRIELNAKKREILSEYNKDDIAKLYEKMQSTRKIADIYHCSKTTIIKVLKERNVPMNTLSFSRYKQFEKEFRKCLCGCGNYVSGWSYKRKRLKLYLPHHNLNVKGNRDKSIAWKKKNLLGKTYEEIYGEAKARNIKSKLKTTLIEKVGKERAEQINSKRREKWLGQKNPLFNNWSSFEPYTPEFNDEFKSLIKLRDNFCCLNCGISEQKHIIMTGRKLATHHINYQKSETNLFNCCSLCDSCHALTNFNRGYWKKLFQEKLSKFCGYDYGNKREIIVELQTEVDNVKKKV